MVLYALLLRKYVMKTEFNSPLTKFEDLKSAMNLTPEGVRIEGTWFVAKSELSREGKHMRVDLVPSTVAFAGTVERITLLLDPDVPPAIAGSEIDNPTFSSYMVGVDNNRNPVYAEPSYRERPEGREPTKDPVTGVITDLQHRIYTAAFLDDHEGTHQPAGSQKARKSAALLAGISAAPAASLPPLTEEDLG